MIDWSNGEFGNAIAWIAILGALVRWDLGISATCLAAGRKLVGLNDASEKGTGVQDALTPPWRTNLAIALWVLSVIVLGYGVYSFGVASGAVLVSTFVASLGISGLIFVPAAESPHYLRLIYRSLLSRRERYRQVGDSVRELAVAELLELFRGRYAGQIK